MREDKERKGGRGRKGRRKEGWGKKKGKREGR